MISLSLLGSQICQAAQPSVQALIRQCEQRLAAREPVRPALSPKRQDNWLTLGAALAAGSANADTAGDVQDPPGDYTPWPYRVGPAYPDDDWRSFGRDVRELPETIWDDTKAVFTDPVALVGILAAGAAGIAINATGVDDAVAKRTDGHRQLCKEADGIGGFFGSPAFHFPLAAVMYGAGLVGDDTKLYETSKTLMNALAINGTFTLLLKWATRTESPNDDENGWPSGHTSSSFCVATVMHKTYGPWVGVPLFAFAGYVGYERIDARNHDFSDVVSGMLIGIAVGHAVANNHETKVLGMEVIPYADPATGAVGLGLMKAW